MHSTAPSPPTTILRPLLRVVYPIFMLVVLNGVGVWLVASGYPRHLLVLVLVVAIGASFLVERVIPYNEHWNQSHDDVGRDWTHFLVNEVANVASVSALPLVAGLAPWGGLWPSGWPLAVQLGLAILVLDFGVTITHWASHRIPLLWRFHAVHHSVKRHYGFNGLMKHPVHQAIELTVGVAPLVVLGIPPGVASLLALATAIQLLLQHSNADYATGPMGYVLALNKGHRFHHQKWPGIGDVNFGLFTNLWDFLLGTWSFDEKRRFTSDDFGIGDEPDYPTGYWDQLTAPFRPKARS
ncbi:sterol desaturase family protein [Pendulispora albinea]|uniref:Sterol desaturase family protein n=1 Tax=Pendulispora albinea TaxID=2741071 RepID=A0ABZ2LZF3_9BACT